MAFDSCADKVFRLSQYQENTNDLKPVGVQLADGTTSFSSAKMTDYGEVVWTKKNGTDPSAEVGALIPGTLATQSKEVGGAEYSYFACPDGTVLCKQDPESMKEILDIMSRGQHATKLDVSTGSPVVPPHLCDHIRKDLAAAAIVKQMRQANASARAANVRLKCRSTHLMGNPAIELDFLFESDPSLFKLVERFKFIKRLSATSIGGLYASAKNPSEFFTDVRNFLSSFDDSNSNEEEITNDNVCDFCLQYPTIDQPDQSLHASCSCRQTISKPIRNVKCAHCDMFSTKNCEAFGIQLCPWCALDSFDRTDAPRCNLCAGTNTFLRHNLVHCLDCVRMSNFDQPHKTVSAPPDTTVPIFSLDDPKRSKTVSWGNDQVIPLLPLSDEVDNFLPSAADPIENNCDHSAPPSESTSESPTIGAFDTPAVSALLVRIHGREFCRVWQLRSVARMLQHDSQLSRAQARAVATRSRTPIKFDGTSSHLTDDEAHHLTHWPHRSDCLCCAHGRKTLAPFVRDGAAKPEDAPGKSFLTFDWVGPWRKASNGHAWVAVVAFYRPNSSTPLVYTQSAPSKADGVSAVILARARQFWGIQHTPFTLKVDGEGCLNDGYLQRYLSLALLPRNQLCVQARQALSSSFTNGDTPCTESGGAKDQPLINSLEMIFDPCDMQDASDSDHGNCNNVTDQMVEEVAKAFNTTTKPRGRPPQANGITGEWDASLGQYIFKPADDANIVRRRGRPNHFEYFIDKIGYITPIKERDHPTHHTGLGEAFSSTPHRSNSNARAERAVRLVVEQVRSILSQSGFRASWWHLVVNALPTLQVTSVNRHSESDNQTQPGRYCGPVVPLGTLGKAKLPPNLRPKSQSMESNLTNVICAGYNHRSTLAVKVLYPSFDHKTKTQSFKTTHLSCRDIEWDVGNYPIKRTLADLEEVSLTANSVLMSMGLQVGPGKDSKNRHKNQTLIRCSKPECGKWRFIKSSKFEDLSASGKDSCWTCDKCSVPQNHEVFEFFDKTNFEPLVNSDEYSPTPPLVDPPDGEPIAVEEADMVKVWATHTLLKSTDVNGSSPLHGALDPEDPKDTQANRDALAYELAYAMVRRSTVTTHDVLSSAKLECKEGEVAFALVLGDGVDAEKRNALETAINGLECSTKIDPALVKARAIILKNKDAFNSESDEFSIFREALDKELNALFDSGVLKAVRADSVSKNSSIIPSMLIASKKPDGRAKCRLVACGNFLSGQDFGDVYSSTVNRGDCFAMIHYAMSAGSMSWYSVDVATAFLQSEINEETRAERKDVFLKVPKVCTDNSTSNCKLDTQLETLWEVCRSIYGLRTAPADWQATLTKRLTEAGFDPVLLDESVLISLFDESGCRTVVACFVDDINVFGPDKEAKAVIDLICTKFKVSAPPVHVNKCTSKDNALMYLAQQYWVQPKPGVGNVLCISMERYIEECLERHGKSDVKHEKSLNPKWFEMDSLKAGKPLSPEAHKAYRGGVAALGYLAQSMRFDISVAINILQSQQANPHEGAGGALDRVWGYVSRTRNRQFEVPCGIPWEELEIVTFSDANFMTDESPRGGHMVCLRSTSHPDTFLPLYWKTQKQKCILMSTTESELVQLAQACKSSLGCLKMIETWKPRYTKLDSITILGDNRAANLIASGCAAPRKVRHLCLSALFVRELKMDPKQYGVNRVTVEAVSGERNLGDVFTKILAEGRLRDLCAIAQMFDGDLPGVQLPEQ